MTTKTHTSPADGATIAVASSPKLRELRVRAVRVPMREPHQTASGAVAESPLVLTDVSFDNGVVGHSMVFTYTPMALTLTPVEAVQRMRVLDGEGLTWVEEPTLAHDYVGHALVAREAATPIQCGENWWGTLDMQHALDAHASDYVMPDVMKIGGVTGWLRAMALAQTRGIRMSNHLWPEISAQLLCVTPTAHWLEYADWWNPVVAEPLVIENGLANVNGSMGSGVAWNERAVERFAA